MLGKSVTWKFAKQQQRLFHKKGETPTRTEELESSPPKSWVTSEKFSVFRQQSHQHLQKQKGPRGKLRRIFGRRRRRVFISYFGNERSMSRHGKRLLRKWLFKATRKKCRGRTGSFTESGAAHKTAKWSGGPGRGGIVIGFVLTYQRECGPSQRGCPHAERKEGRQKEGK